MILFQEIKIKIKKSKKTPFQLCIIANCKSCFSCLIVDRKKRNNHHHKYTKENHYHQSSILQFFLLWNICFSWSKITPQHLLACLQLFVVVFFFFVSLYEKHKYKSEHVCSHVGLTWRGRGRRRGAKVKQSRKSFHFLLLWKKMVKQIKAK